MKEKYQNQILVTPWTLPGFFLWSSRLLYHYYKTVFKMQSVYFKAHHYGWVGLD